jgi:hypothetical protein
VISSVTKRVRLVTFPTVGKQNERSNSQHKFVAVGYFFLILLFRSSFTFEFIFLFNVLVRCCMMVFEAIRKDGTQH